MRIKNLFACLPLVNHLMNNRNFLTLPVGAGLFVDGYELTITASVIVLIPHFWLSNVTNIGYIGSAAVLGTLIGALIAGPVSDLFGRSKFLVFDMLLISLCALLSSLSWNIDVLLFLRFFTGLAIGADYPLSSAYLAEVLPAKHRGRYMAITIGFWMLGAIFAAIIGFLLSDIHNGWRYMLAIGAIFPLIIIFFRNEVLNTEIKDEKINTSVFFNDVIFSLRSDQKKYILAIVPRFILDFIGYSFHLYLPFMLFTAGIASKSNALKLNIIFMVTFVFGWLPCVFLIDKIGRIRLQYIGFLGSGLSLLFLFLTITYFKSYVFLIVLSIIFYQISSFFGPSVTAWILPVELFKHNIRATWQSISTLIAHFGGLLAALFIPRLVHIIGISNVFICLSVIAFIGSFVTYIYKYETMLIDLK